MPQRSQQASVHSPKAANGGGRQGRASASVPSAVAPTPLAVLQQFRELFRVSQRHFQSIEARCGLGGAQLWALSEIGKRPGLTISELARQLSIHLSTSSNLLDKLEAQGLIRRERRSTDQRLVRVYATAAGTKVLARAPKPVEGIIPDALGRMPASTVRRLHEDMQELLKVASARSARAAMKPLAEA